MNRFIESQSSKVYDLIIIGGGITGAAVAYEAASRGYSVALVDQGDFGAATSAATSKLIHGGARYLANLEFNLVRESLRERRILENIAPNLVYPLPFVVPLYKTGTRRKSIVEPGMILYDILSYDKQFTWDKSKRLPNHRMLGAGQILSEYSIVNPAGLTGAVCYYDCTCISPERLTLAFIKSAVKYGAEVSNYARVEGFIKQADKIEGVIVHDLLKDRTVELRGRLTVNCAGPWADLVLNAARGEPGSRQIRRSEGIHIITRCLSEKVCVAGMTPSGRWCNVIPWRGHSLIGTTDQEYRGDPDHYEVTRERIEAYIDEVNETFGNKDLIKYSDVLYAYGGLRPLVEDQTREVYKTSRRYEIYDNEQDGLKGFITVEGGKYTTSRSLAVNVIKKVSRKLGKKPKKSISARNYLDGCEIQELEAFLALAKAANCDFEGSTVDFLARMYGTEYIQVLDLARQNKRLALPLNKDGEIAAQIVFAIRNEMARTATDILLRRTGLGTLGNPGEQVLDAVIRIAADELNWNTAAIEREIASIEKIYACSDISMLADSLTAG